MDNDDFVKYVDKLWFSEKTIKTNHDYINEYFQCSIDNNQSAYLIDTHIVNDVFTFILL